MPKLVIVTGGTRGIGAAISVNLKNEGYIVVANYNSNEESALNFQKETGIKTKKWDVSDYDTCIRSVEEIEKAFGQTVDILVNNAGITRDSVLHKMKIKDWDDVISTNLTSCFNMSYSVISQMRQKNYGRIVNISSINGLAGQLGQANYSAAKAGVIGFSKALARESASKGITVNVIAPGYIETEMVAKVPREILEKIVNNIPVKRLGTPSEIARAVNFLVSSDAGFITGETISINGGQNMV
ncbi:MAG: SDR family oxidoreductase [Alphaproteobacteria bacterium]|nr:SDR family oxidoreductase [Alphaproteobacteria bacterium]